MSTIRPYRSDDRDAVLRIWREVRWIEPGENHQERGLDVFLTSGDALVGEVDGVAECFVHRTPGRIRHSTDDLPLSAVTAVTTSRVARGLGLASALTARLVAEAASSGAAVAALGMFEQGFYDRFGFGTGSYEHRFTLDPADLVVARPDRRPVRLGPDDAGEIDELLRRRRRHHGGIVLDEPSAIAAELHWAGDDLLALGHRGDDGRLVGALIGEVKGEHAAEVELLAGETGTDVLALLGLLRSLGDQYSSVLVTEPPGLQLQDLLARPIRAQHRADDEDHPTVMARAWWQARILDLPRCLAAVDWRGAPLRLQLRVADPIDEHDVAWPGVGGDWVVELGPTCSAERGRHDDLPTLTTGVGALTRWWLGVRPAASLALTDDLAGPADLLGALDDGLALPPPDPGLYF